MCLEFIRDEEDEYHVLECNPRFSGGIAFSKAAGFDFVRAHLDCFAETPEEMQYLPTVDLSAVEEDIYLVKKYSEVQM